MKRKVVALIACGTGIATSTAVREKVKDALKEAGYDPDMKQCKISEMKSQIENVNPDVVISTGPVSGNYGAPVINGVNFLTGRGIDKTMEEIIAALDD